MKISGRKAIVTGGASGLGAATVKALLSEGMTVAIFDLDKEKGAQLADELGAAFYRLDVTDEKAVIEAMDDFRGDGNLHVLVNCAGIAPEIPMFTYEGPHRLDVFERTQAVNSTGTFITCLQFAYRAGADTEEEAGIIINTSSIAAQDGQMQHVAYAASKGAVEAMTLPMARNLASKRIRVVSIAPGLFEASMAEFSHITRKDNLGQAAPHPARLGDAEEFAALAMHIIDNPMVNGTTLRIDGALRLDFSS